VWLIPGAGQDWRDWHQQTSGWLGHDCHGCRLAQVDTRSQPPHTAAAGAAGYEEVAGATIATAGEDTEDKELAAGLMRHQRCTDHMEKHGMVEHGTELGGTRCDSSRNLPSLGQRSQDMLGT